MTEQQNKEIEEIVERMSKVQIDIALFGLRHSKEFKGLSEEDKEEFLKESIEDAKKDKDFNAQLNQVRLGLHSMLLELQ